MKENKFHLPYLQRYMGKLTVQIMKPYWSHDCAPVTGFAILGTAMNEAPKNSPL